MKKILTILLLLFCWIWASGAGAATTYHAIKNSAPNYVKYSTTSCADADAAGTPATDLEAVGTLTGNGDTLEICSLSGNTDTTYTDLELDSDNSLFITSSLTRYLVGSYEDGYKGKVTLHSTAGHALNFGANGTLSNIGLKSTHAASNSLFLPNNVNVTGSNLVFSGGTLALRIQPATGYTQVIKESLFESQTNTVTAIEMGNTSSGSGTAMLISNIFKNNTLSPVIVRVNDGTNYILKNHFIRIAKTPIQLASGGESDPVIELNTFVACAYGGNYQILDDAGTGTMQVGYNIILPKALVGDDYTWDAFNDLGGNQYTSPLFRQNRRKGIVVIGVDDYANFDYWSDLADLADTYGIKVTSFLSQPWMMEAGEWTTLQGYVDDGHGVTSHSMHHINMTDMDAFRVQYTGDATTAVMTVSTTTLTVTLSGDQTDGSANISMDLTDLVTYDSDSNGYLENDEVYGYINGLTGYTATQLVALNNLAVVEEFADVVSQDIKTATYDVQLDQNRVLTIELGESQTEIEANLADFECDTYAPAGNATNAAMYTTYPTYYKGAKDDENTSDAMNLEELSLFRIRVINGGDAFDTTSEANIRRNAAALVEQIAELGQIIVLQTHSYDEFGASLEEALANWGYVIEEILKNPNVRIMTFSDAVKHARGELTGFLNVGAITDYNDSGAVDSATTRVSMTFTDDSVYSLQANSPGINKMTAAAAVTLFTGLPTFDDVSGRVCWSGTALEGPCTNGVSIGAYEDILYEKPFIYDANGPAIIIQ